MDNTSAYDPNWVRSRYDDQGEQEWKRFARSPVDEVSLFVHTHYLHKFVKPGSRVLDVGAGPGRFTQILAEIGCQVVAADISPVQLELHRQHAEELKFEHAVENRLLLDICDMNTLEDESFDVVVCYGGPLSYVFDLAPVALGECVRVCKKSGLVLASVMSLWGGAHRFLQGVLTVPIESNRKITDSGDLTPSNWEGAEHHCHMFRVGELRQMASEAGLNILAMSASNCVSTVWDELIADARDDADKWQEVLRMELEACADEGCVGMGAHTIVVGEKT